jgi:diguanylate cyclase (GGDEF)-like protein/PAS domain S-box-containing protein
MLPAEQHPDNEQQFITTSYKPTSEQLAATTECFQLCSPFCNSHWRRTEAVLRRHAQQQAAVATLGQRALMNIDLPNLMQEAVATVTQVLKIQYCAIFELLPNGSTLMLQAGTGWQSGLVGATLMGTQPNWLFGYTLTQQQPVVIKDLVIETRFSCPSLLHNHQIKSGINLVISGQEQPFGILGIYTTQLWKFTQDDIHFLQAVANVLAATASRKKSEARLRLMERAIAASSNGIILTDVQQPDNPVVYVNPAFEAMTGYRADEMLGRNCRLLQRDDRDQVGLERLRAALQENRECHVVVRNYRKDGSLFWNELRVAPVYDTDGYLTHFVGVQTDITDRIRTEEALKASEQKLDSILKSLEDVVWSYSLAEKRLRYLNLATEKVYGRPVSEFLHDPDLWFKVIHPDDQIQVQQALLRLQHISNGEIEYRILHSNGEVRWLCDRYHVTYDAEGVPFSLDGIATDITERKRMQEQLIHDACHDALTGLPNRVLFMKQLAQAIARAKKSSDHLFAVLFLDLDRFKLVNDSLGHLVGDQLLVAIAHRLATCLRPNETIARLGGDEFTILLDGMEHGQEATDLAERIRKTLQLPFSLNGDNIFTSASIGIALSIADYDSPEQVLRDADIALYHAKGHRKMSYAVFNTAMYNETVALLQLETALRWAIERKQLCVYYQPIVSLETGLLTGFEALVRWQHPERLDFSG